MKGNFAGKRRKLLLGKGQSAGSLIHSRFRVRDKGRTDEANVGGSSPSAFYRFATDRRARLRTGMLRWAVRERAAERLRG